MCLRSRKDERMTIASAPEIEFFLKGEKVLAKNHGKGDK